MSKLLDGLFKLVMAGGLLYLALTMGKIQDNLQIQITAIVHTIGNIVETDSIQTQRIIELHPGVEGWTKIQTPTKKEDNTL